MKSLIIAALLSLTSFALAVEPPADPGNMTEPNPAPQGEGDVVGTIQEPSHHNKKIIKKIMDRKGKPKADGAKKKPAKPADPNEVKK